MSEKPMSSDMMSTMFGRGARGDPRELANPWDLGAATSSMAAAIATSGRRLTCVMVLVLESR
jgi:hypothetical protein